MSAVWRHVRERIERVPPWVYLVVAALVLFVYAFPGYLNWDGGQQLYQARVPPRNDWHPPIMAAYWHPLDMIISGPLLMLVLQITLFSWGLYRVYRVRLSERPAAIAAALTLLFPPVFTPMAPVWKDAQMAAFLIAGLALGLRPRWYARVGALVLLFFATGVRDNAAAALPPLLIVLVATWGVRRRLFVLAIAGVLTVATFAGSRIANSQLTDERSYVWYRTVAIHDLAGTICHEAPMSDDEVRALLDGIPLFADHDLQATICKAYTPRVWFALSFYELRVFEPIPDRADRLARKAAWKRAVHDHTGAWLAHRWAVMREVLGLTITPPWEPVCQTMQPNTEHPGTLLYDAALSPLQEHVGKFFIEHWAPTIFYRPWAYALGCLLLLVFAIVRRDGWIAMLVGSGLLYEAGYFVGAAAPDFRYSHWLVTCCCIAVVTVFVERLQSGRRRA